MNILRQGWCVDLCFGKCGILYMSPQVLWTDVYLSSITGILGPQGVAGTDKLCAQHSGKREEGLLPGGRFQRGSDVGAGVLGINRLHGVDKRGRTCQADVTSWPWHGCVNPLCLEYTGSTLCLEVTRKDWRNRSAKVRMPS